MGGIIEVAGLAEHREVLMDELNFFVCFACLVIRGKGLARVIGDD